MKKPWHACVSITKDKMKYLDNNKALKIFEKDVTDVSFIFE